MFDDPPQPGDAAGGRTVRSCVCRRAARPACDARVGRAERARRCRSEFLPRGYDLESSIGLVATPADSGHSACQPGRDRARARSDADERLWQQVIELQVRPSGEEDAVPRSPSISKRRGATSERPRRGTSRSTARRSWSCGVVVTDGRSLPGSRHARVDRRRASARAWLSTAQACRRAPRRRPVRDRRRRALHALGLYESLGFERAERALGVCRPPRGPGRCRALRCRRAGTLVEMAAPVQRDQELELSIDSLAFGGNGVARLDGFVVFVRRGPSGRHGPGARHEGAAPARRGDRDRSARPRPARGSRRRARTTPPAAAAASRISRTRRRSRTRSAGSPTRCSASPG